ncbi:ABC transporter substrate-binding protein [Bradyrhizobium sp.]|uniref:ABC transporter substrate-binding protein n=1 Tax=Bradyrhizobium sp. TaxID=376 RepID=UPI0025BEF661|nr:ABC transporter substrate-binding protein [Bradyrhizobium sp.]
MRRRDLITLIGGAAAWPLGARAQHMKMYTIGVLTLTSPDPKPLLEALREGLRDAGYVEGRNLRLEIRSAAGRPDLQLEKAAELVGLKVDLIVTFFTPAALAAKQATRDIPIVMAGAGDPVASGLVASLAQPGGNVTGQSSGGAELAGKSVELIRELIPTAQRLGVLGDENDPFVKPYVEQIREAARRAGVEVDPIMLRPELSLEAAFKSLAGKGADALLIQGSIAHKEMLDLAIEHRLPAVTSTRLGPSLGALMSYGSDYFALARQSAIYVDKILKGARPADLPVAFPTKFLLIINVTTAKTLGINISPTMLSRADEVIE